MNVLKFFFLTILAVSLSTPLFAAKVDTVVTYSPSMKKEIKAVVVTPDNYKKSKKYPVVYLLHGYSGNYASWMQINEAFIKSTADTQEVIIVSPDGGYGSWYLDSPVDEQWKYETYIVREFIPWIDEQYSTIASPKGRGITGLSMGGHGALYLAFRHQDIFGVAGSMSGGVDIRPFPNNWDLSKRLGTYALYPDNWEKYSVINLTHLLTPNSLQIMIDCGTGDFFYQINCQLHQKLLDRNIPHDFISRPGKHNGEYWKNAVQYQLLFMVNFFEANAR